jgi:hypothetical protein
VSRPRFTHDFCEALIRRLKAGDDPEALRVELNIGSATMTRYVGIARQRSAGT